MIERDLMKLRACVGIASVLLCCGLAMGQSSQNDATATQPKTPNESVGGLDVAPEGEATEPEKRRKKEYITDPLFVGRLSETMLLGLYEREIRKMKQSPPTPKELVLTESQAERVEAAFSSHREELRKYNNEVQLVRLELRKLSGLGTGEPAKTGEEEDFSPLLHIDPKMIGTNAMIGGSIKVRELTEEQYAAREELRVLILTGPVVEDLRATVFSFLEEDQKEALEEIVRAFTEKKLTAQASRLKTKRTGQLEYEDLPESTRKQLDELNPKQRAAALEKYRMERISGGARKMKQHRDAVQRQVQKTLRERDEKERQEQAEQEATDEGSSEEN